ncbi:hypothetical protein diail_1813 [Diaporthe ilicicola]|nr:hypothetical protein diail_1813 [Diaporthe ilicicola]
MERIVAPRVPVGGDSLADLSSTILAGYAQWLKIEPTPNGEGEWLADFDCVVKTVSKYLERWEDPELWSRICAIVVEVPWRENLKALAEIKVGAWHYLTTSDRRNTDRYEADAFHDWESRLQELFEDLVDRLVDIPLQSTEGTQSPGRFISMTTCSSLRKSINGIADSWDVGDIRNNKKVVFEDWVEVESCWEFMKQSKADCLALRAKFIQLQALKRLYRREQREFLIC